MSFFLQKRKSPLSLIKKVQKLVISKYNKEECNYNKIILNHLIFNEKCKIVVEYKDFLIFNEEIEFLKKYYTKEDSYQRLNKILNFYEKYTQIFPNYMILPENQFLYTNIRKKQKMIDAVNIIKNEEEINKNNIKNNPNEIFTKQINDDIQKCQPSNIIFNEDESSFSISIFSKKNNQTPDNSFNLDLTKNLNEINDTNGSIENILNDLKGNNKKKNDVKKPTKKIKKNENKININNNYHNKPLLNHIKSNSNVQKVISNNYNMNKKGNLMIYNNCQNIIIPKENTIININNNYYQYTNPNEENKNYKSIHSTKQILKNSKTNNTNFNNNNINNNNNNINNNNNNCIYSRYNTIGNTQINILYKSKNTQRSTAKKPNHKLKLDDEYENFNKEFSPKTTRNINKLFKSPSRKNIRNKKIDKSDNLLKSSQTIKRFTYNPNANKLYNAIFLNNKNSKNKYNDSKSSFSNTISVKKIEKKSSKLPLSSLNSSKKKFYENEKNKILNLKTPKKNELINDKNIPWTEIKENYKKYMKNEICNNTINVSSTRNSCDNFLFIKRQQKDFFKDKFGYNKNKKYTTNNTPIKRNFFEKEFLNIVNQKSTKNTSSITESKDYSNGKNNTITIKVNRQSFLEKLKKKFENNSLVNKDKINSFDKTVMSNKK